MSQYDIDLSQVRHDLLTNVTVIDVTPELAEKWLVHNTHNRNRKVRAIERMVADMVHDAWSWTGAAICFANDGTLLDGQNRLYAVIESGKTIPMIVVTGLALEAQNDIDTGTVRKLADVLSMHGETNASTLGGLIRLAEAWERGHRATVFNTAALGSNSACLTFLDAHPEMRDIANWAKNANIAGLSPGLLGLAYWATSRIDDEDADFFFARLEDGQQLVKGNAIFELRRTLAERSARLNTTLNRTWALAIVFKGWNAFRDGAEVGIYRWARGGSRPEAFPVPR